ncbi:MAG TPA: hypothetical protein VFD06_05100 [Candidatus Polarisedimenticolia bacterium]|nr:hypothetical protein [Candidatus Polarisedimenticolia bacterium]
MKLGERFIQQGLLTPAQLEAALKAQLIFGGHLGTVLLEFGHVDEHTLGKTLGKIFNVDYAPPGLFTDIPKTILDLVPKRLVEKHHAVPFDKRDRHLAVAMIDPKDLQAIDEISFATGHTIHPWVAPEARIFQVMERYYDLPRRHRYISVCQTLDAAGAAAAKGPGGPSERERAVLDSAYAPPPYLAALGSSPPDAAADAEGPPPAPLSITGIDGEAGPGTETQLSDSLCRSEGASEIAEAAVQFLSSRLKRSILFLVRGDTATVWRTHGPAQSTPTALLPLTSEPLFALLHERDHYQGPLPAHPRIEQMMATFGMKPPREIVLLPGYLDDRLLVIVYGDSGPDAAIAAEVGDLRPIVTKIACALHLVALKRRIRSTAEAAEAAAPSQLAAKAA